MADRRFDLPDAIEMLHTEARRVELAIKAEAIRLEEHLRQAYKGRELGILNAQGADYLHVFEVNATAGVQVGARLELNAYGMQLGGSLVAPAIKVGRYRAVLTLTKLDEDA